MDEITNADTAAFDRLTGRTTTDEERTQLLPLLTRTRNVLLTLRTNELARSYAPALTFDPRVPGTRFPTGKSALDFSPDPLPAYDGNPETLAFSTVAELARLIKARKVTSRELTEMYLVRMEKYGPRLLCVVALCEERALAEATKADAEIARGKWRGPLHGIPYGLKDLFAARGTLTTFGAKPYENQNWDFDSTVAERLRKAGAVLLGKLSMGELALGDTWFGGTTRNPWKPETGSSGSSAGSASATAAGLVGFAIGTETWGSIVSPCAVCGTTGLRPTFGRVSRHGVMALSWSMDKVGPITRGVEDCALVFAAIHGADGQDRSAIQAPFQWQPNRHALSSLRVGVEEKSFEDATASQRSVLETLKTLGVKTVPVTLPETNAAYDALPMLTIRVEGAAAFAELIADGKLPELAQQADWNWPNLLRGGATIPASDYLQAQRVRHHLQREMARSLAEVDVYVSVPLKGPSLAYTNLAGQPTVITRCGLSSDKLPEMIEFTGALFREDAALRLAHAYEQAANVNRSWPDADILPGIPPLLAGKK